MSRKILLIEPAYKNKYPPLGLMKISSYHKMLGDEVIFFKGKSKELREIKWDRIYITTLFSFYWNMTIDTIKFYKRSVKKIKDFYIGGIMSSLMADNIFNETGIKPVVGLLDKPKMLNDNNDIIVDHVVPDYDILEEIDYAYPAGNAYFFYTTRGCVRKCPFCAVPKLEPKYKNYISIKEQIKEIDRKYGHKKNLLLLDNNVLASKHFPKIIEEIKKIGFYKGAKYQHPIKFNLLIERLRNGENNTALLQKISNLIRVQPLYIKNETARNNYFKLLEHFDLSNGINRKQLLSAQHEIMPYFDKYRNKAYGLRYVDFNQGIDPRLITEEKMKLLSEIPISPLRIAFDSLEPEYKKRYIRAIELAAKYGIKNLSNYILYNWDNDTPNDFYNRLKINTDLNSNLDVRIYSFPMKYIPVINKNRNYIGPYWNLKYIRAIQKVLLVTGGAVMPERSFFENAFGKDLQEFHKIMLMPEDYIIYRKKHESNGDTKQWWNIFKSLSKEEYNEVIKIIETKNLDDAEQMIPNKKIIGLLKHYRKKKPQHVDTLSLFKEMGRESLLM